MTKPSNKSLKKIQKRLYIILTIQTLLAILKFPISLNLAINELISCILLFLGIYYKNFCLIAFYCIFLLFHILQYIKILGIKIQNVIKFDENFLEDSKTENFFFFLVFVSLFFGAIFSYLVFRGYRYFKFQSFKGRMGGFSGDREVMNFERFKGGEEEVVENRNADFKAFEGKGIRLG